MTYKIFDTLQEYNDFTLNGTHLTAGTLYLVKENKSLYFLTNNIDGEAEKYEYLDEIPEGYIKPEGNIIITENGEEIDISQYATASVDVAPNLTTQSITENGTYEPSGDYDGFSSVTVNVAGSGDEVLRDLIERDITSITIPNTVTSIGNSAFQECSGLTSITIPNSVTSIGNIAFHNCTSLTNITIPDSVTSIGDYAFQICSSLTSVTIPNTVTSIGNSAFNSCSSLTSVTIPDGVTSIGNGAFRNSGIKSLVLNGGGVIGSGTSYGTPGAFEHCSRLSNVTIGSGVTSLGINCFSDCYYPQFNSVVIPDSVTYIGLYCFSNCSYLNSITIGNGITNIDQQAFAHTIRLTSLTINATTPPTLGANALVDTNDNLIIYVPAESVEAYKTATNWSNYASRIQAIS